MAEKKSIWSSITRNIILLAALILVFILQYAGITREIDIRVCMLFYPIKEGIFETGMTLITNIFGPVMLFIGSAIFLIILLYHRHFTLAKIFAAHMICSFISLLAIKFAVQRMRPSQPSVMIDEFSFPSGHATLSMAFFGFLLFVLHQKTGSKRLLIVVDLLALFIIALVGFSRIFLSFHWLTDVIGGYILGLFWLSVFSALYEWYC